MIVTRVFGSNFMAYDELDVTLPEKGLVVITGKNWEGKSAIIDAVSTTLWGETVRGSYPWRPGSKCHIGVETSEGLAVQRTCSPKGSKGLRWGDEGVVPKKSSFPTASKAQAALLDRVGGRDVWLKCAVFSSEAADQFTHATDKQRKALLETVLGSKRFDKALDRCRQELRKAETRVNELGYALTHNQSTRDEQAILIKETEQAIEDLQVVGSVNSLEKKIAAKVKKEKALQEKYTLNTFERDQLRLEVTKAKMAEEAAQERKAKFEDGNCPTCYRPADEEVLGPIEVALKEAEDRIRDLEDADAKFERWREEGNDLSNQIGEVREELETLREELAEARQCAKTKAVLTKQLKGHQARHTQAVEFLEEAEVGLLEAKTEVTVLKACEQVLGIRGVRSQILGRSLEGIEGIANMYLARIVSDFDARVRLKPYTELKSGDVNDAISLEIEGWEGAEHGYEAASTGAKRLVNINILLGLATLADAALGRPASDLWMDEIFDALDDERVEAVGDVLVEIAEERKVVVISHNPRLVEHLERRAALRLHVEAHQVHTRAA